MTIAPAKTLIEVTSGNTRTPIGLTLKQSGVAVPLSELTVKFKLIDDDGEVAIAETDSNLTVVDAEAGQIEIKLQAAGALAAGTYYLFITLYSGDDYDTFPHDGRMLAVQVAANEPAA